MVGAWAGVYGGGRVVLSIWSECWVGVGNKVRRDIIFIMCMLYLFYVCILDILFWEGFWGDRVWVFFFFFFLIDFVYRVCLLMGAWTGLVLGLLMSETAFKQTLECLLLLSLLLIVIVIVIIVIIVIELGLTFLHILQNTHYIHKTVRKPKEGSTSL